MRFDKPIDIKYYVKIGVDIFDTSFVEKAHNELNTLVYKEVFENVINIGGNFNNYMGDMLPTKRVNITKYKEVVGLDKELMEYFVKINRTHYPFEKVLQLYHTKLRQIKIAKALEE